MFSISFPDGLLLLEVEANDGLVRLFYGFCCWTPAVGLRCRGGLTPSMRVRVVSGVSDGGNGTPSRRYFGSTATERPRRGPNASKSLKKTPSAFSDQDESRRWREGASTPQNAEIRTFEVLLLVLRDLLLQIFRQLLRALIQRVVVSQVLVHRVPGVI